MIEPAPLERGLECGKNSAMTISHDLLTEGARGVIVAFLRQAALMSGKAVLSTPVTSGHMGPVKPSRLSAWFRVAYSVVLRRSV
jgi:hypothetical protein